jgi:hypothetical protein
MFNRTTKVLLDGRIDIQEWDDFHVDIGQKAILVLETLLVVMRLSDSELVDSNDNAKRIADCARHYV